MVKWKDEKKEKWKQIMDETILFFLGYVIKKLLIGRCIIKSSANLLLYCIIIKSGLQELWYSNLIQNCWYKIDEHLIRESLHHSNLENIKIIE